jgi:ribonuclease HI
MRGMAASGGEGKPATRPQGRRRPRRAGRATTDAERRALAKAHARPARPIASAPPRFAVLQADGGARGAPGPAAIGYVIDDEAGVRLAEHAEAIGVAGATVAEYRALLAGLNRAHALGLLRVAARSDSRLLITHLNGDRHVRNPALRALEAEIADVRMRIGAVVFDWIPADANRAAHELVARVLETGPR